MSNLRIIDVSPETARLDALRSFGILDTAPEKIFDEVARLAGTACETPYAGLSFIDQDRCWLKARIGIDVREAPRNDTICNYAFKSSGLFVVTDTRQDKRFQHLEIVTQGKFHFYAGIPLITTDGHSLGTLWVMDNHPRELTSWQISTLRTLADHAMTLLNRRRVALAPPSARAKQPTRNGSILIVDDDPDVRAFSRIAVLRLGYDVIVATNGQEALEQFTRNPSKIDLVLTDINMPIMDGLELVRVLRKLPMTPAIVVMSGRFDSHIRAGFQAEEVTLFLCKPFSVDDLELTLLQAKASIRG